MPTIATPTLDQLADFARSHGCNAWVRNGRVAVEVPWSQREEGTGALISGVDVECARTMTEMRSILGY